MELQKTAGFGGEGRAVGEFAKGGGDFSSEFWQALGFFAAEFAEHEIG